jgi:hypothetical protein
VLLPGLALTALSAAVAEPERTTLFGRAAEFNPALAACAFAGVFAREAVKKCDCVFRIVDALAARPLGLKLARVVVAGILPVAMLALRSVPSPIACWCIETRAWPNCFEFIELSPERTRRSVSIRLIFEN